jgi:dihydrofolate reductase
MSKLVVTNHLTLDGVMQSPASPDEDTRDGFAGGGWAAPRAAADSDEVMGRVIGEDMARGGSLLLGRRTYEHFYGFWPHQTDNPFTEVLNESQKYVASRTLEEPLPWENSTLLGGDVADAVTRLKEQPGNNIVVLGSGDLLQTLMRHQLVDEYLLMIHPVVLGSGRRMFPDGTAFTNLRLLESLPTGTGVVIARYERA